MDFGRGRTDGYDQHSYREQEREGTSSYSRFTHSSSSSSSSFTLCVPPAGAVKKEPMFHKILTPSDVGKLNRLVIPKQHAEKYFPLDPAAADSGLQLSFEDRAGKPWRFRYSYWKSSQSYVMTKGWTRFVKEKRLNAGDTVSFCHGTGEASRECLFIEWHRRAQMPPIPASPFATANFPTGTPRFFYSHPRVHQPVVAVPVVMNSMPLVPGKNETKRVRLFGVNLECSEQKDGGEAGGMKLVQIMPPQTPIQWRIGLVQSTVPLPGSTLKSPIDLQFQPRDREEGRR